MKLFEIAKMTSHEPKEKDSRYQMLKTALNKQDININVKSAYFIFGVPYSESNLDLIKKDISIAGLEKIKERFSYNVQTDNIDVFLVEDIQEGWTIILLLDRYDYLAGDPVIDVIPTLEFNYEKEIIFPL
jgi:hypothetical protein